MLQKSPATERMKRTGNGKEPGKCVVSGETQIEWTPLKKGKPGSCVFILESHWLLATPGMVKYPRVRWLSSVGANSGEAGAGWEEEEGMAVSRHYPTLTAAGR